MAFRLGSKIKIGSFGFRGVHEVRIKKSMRSYVNTALIKIPAKCRVLKKDGKTIDEIETGRQFTEGDVATINLGYNGELKEEFTGFVRRINFNVPLEVELEGYSWQLRRNKVMPKSWAKTTVKEVMEHAIIGTEVCLKIQDDIPLINIVIHKGSTSAEVLDYILDKATDGVLKAYFIDTYTLWVGLEYTAEKSKVKYVLGKNTIRDNQLKEHIKEAWDLKIVFKHNTPTGVKRLAMSQQKSGKANVIGKEIVKMLQQVSDLDWLKKLADQKVADESYNGYEGRINAFLQPYCEAGDVAILKDNKYDGIKNGNYIIDEIEVAFGLSGARRSVSISKQLS